MLITFHLNLYPEKKTLLGNHQNVLEVHFLPPRVFYPSMLECFYCSHQRKCCGTEPNTIYTDECISPSTSQLALSPTSPLPNLAKFSLRVPAEGDRNPVSQGKRNKSCHLWGTNDPTLLEQINVFESPLW